MSNYDKVKISYSVDKAIENPFKILNSSSESSKKSSSLSFENENLNNSDDLELFLQNTSYEKRENKLKSNVISNSFGEIPLDKIKNIENFYTDGILNVKLDRQLKRGYIFGELGLLYRKTRAATIICNQDTEFAVATKTDFYYILALVKDQKRQKKIQFFTLSIFSGFEKYTVNDILYLFSKKKFLNKDKIFIQGDEVDHVYLIKKGEIQLTCKDLVLESSQEKHNFFATTSNLTRKSKLLFPPQARNILVSPPSYSITEAHIARQLTSRTILW